jgi:WD40 repeat protein
MRHVGPISGIACFEGRYVATAGYDNQVILWDAGAGRALARGYHDHLVNQCDFDPRGEYLVTASSDSTARLWSLPDLRLKKVLLGHDDDVMKASFSPDGSLIATSSYDSTLGIYTRDGEMLHRLRGHHGLVEGFDWSRDGKTVQSCGTDGTLRTWDAATGECIGVESFSGIDLDVVVTTRSGVSYVGDNAGGITRIAANGERLSVDGHASGVKRLILDPEEARLISLGYDNSLVLWTIGADGALSLARRSVYPDCVWARSAAFLDGRRSVHGTFGSKYAVWDWAEDAWDLENVEPAIGLNAILAHEGRVYAIGDGGALMCDGRKIGGPGTLCNFVVALGDLLLTGGQKGVVYDAVSGAPLYDHGIPLNCGAAFERGGVPHVAIGSYSGHILVFRAEGGGIALVERIEAHENAIKGVSTDGKRFFSGCADGELGIWDVETLERVRAVEDAHDGILNATCAFRDGFATVSRDLTLRLWRDEGEPEVLKTRHPNSIKSAASDTDGVLIASGSYGGTIEVYDVEGRAWLEPSLRPTAAGISNLAWDAASGCFVASSYDGQVFQVRATPGKATSLSFQRLSGPA